FVGLLGGFVSGSETSYIAMFTEYQYLTGIKLGLSENSIVVLGASNGIGGGLASVLSPAKIQNATAVIDKQGIEGEVIKKTAPIALLMVFSVSLITLCWSNNYPAWKWAVVFAIGIGAVAVLLLSIFGINKLRNRKKEQVKAHETEEKE
ncbi:MAG: L-lactate permease, partial [Candidatus Heimdallarchaeota archaeon]|nr:L-lactate permease [Candidatus Heimdallarchaeota archaeon]